MNDLRECIKELDKCIDLAGRPNYRGECQKEDFAKLKGSVYSHFPPPPLLQQSILALFLSGLFNGLISAVLAERVSAEGLSKPGDFIYELLAKADIKHQTAEPICNLLDMAISDLVGGKRCYPPTPSHLQHFLICWLASFLQMTRKISPERLYPSKSLTIV